MNDSHTEIIMKLNIGLRPNTNSRKTTQDTTHKYLNVFSIFNHIYLLKLGDANPKRTLYHNYILRIHFIIIIRVNSPKNHMHNPSNLVYNKSRWFVSFCQDAENEVQANLCNCLYSNRSFFIP